MYLAISVPYRIISKKRKQEKDKELVIKKLEKQKENRAAYLKQIGDANEAMEDRPSAEFDDLP